MAKHAGSSRPGPSAFGAPETPEERAARPVDNVECTVQGNGWRKRAVNFDHAFRMAAGAAYDSPGQEVRVLEPGMAILVLVQQEDGGLKPRRETP